jgi:Skp family chaperone for outer membrane proteins
MNKFTYGTAAAALALALPAMAAAQQRTAGAVIVVVDTGRVTQECTACRAATTQLQGMITSGQQQAQAIAAPLQTEAQQIQAQAQAGAAMPAGAAKTAAETAVRTRAQAFETRQQQANQQIQRIEQNIQSTRQNVSRQVFERLNPIISQVMTAHGANLAVDVDQTLAHAPALDVTNEVLTALNTALPSVSVTPMPQPPAPAQQPQGR